MKHIFFLLFSLSLFGCTLNLYSEKTRILPKIFEVVSINASKNSLTLRHKDSDVIHTGFLIPAECKSLIKVGDILILDEITTNRNGITTVTVVADTYNSSSCFGKSSYE